MFCNLLFELRFEEYIGYQGSPVYQTFTFGDRWTFLVVLAAQGRDHKK